MREQLLKEIRAAKDVHVLCLLVGFCQDQFRQLPSERAKETMNEVELASFQRRAQLLKGESEWQRR